MIPKSPAEAEPASRPASADQPPRELAAGGGRVLGEPADHAVEHPVEHKGQRFHGLVSLADRRLGTRRYRSGKGLLPAGADVFLPMLHGMGPATSHAGGMLATLNTLTASKKKTGRSQSLKALRELPGYRLAGGEAIDLPGAHCRPVPASLADLPQLCDWVVDWLAPIKQSLGVPIAPIARSASAMIVAGVLDRLPGLIDAVVMLSPMAPFDAEHSNADLLRRVAASQCELNRPAFDYMNHLTGQTDWDRRPDPFAGVPTLILTGERDTQVSDRVRGRCADWGRTLPHVEFRNVTGAGHDVFNLRDRGPGLDAFAALFAFLDRVVG